MKSTPWELSNDMLHNAESELHRKILIVDRFPGKTLIGDIFISISAMAVKKGFFGSPFNDEVIHICY